MRDTKKFFREISLKLNIMVAIVFLQTLHIFTKFMYFELLFIIYQKNIKKFYIKKMNFNLKSYFDRFLLIKEFYKENYKQIFRSFEGNILVLIFRFQARSLETFPIDHGKENLEADVRSVRVESMKLVRSNVAHPRRFKLRVHRLYFIMFKR